MPEVQDGGSIIIKRIGDQEYVYVKHGRTWHYIGPLSAVDLPSIMTEYTTPLPLKETQTKVGAGDSMSNSQELSKNRLARS
ncbi:MAG: hypothetical protein ACP5L5_11360 [Vulcanisaeta sp.]|uniref:hypothetical protein n=1 Tax=Vulcanisaeta sp. TaxID=2020871 RepID=UPI003D09A5A3